MLRRLEPLSILLVALCVIWTARVHSFGEGYLEAGGLMQTLVWDGEYGRMATTLLIHGGWIHLIFNSIALYVLGAAVARGCGRRILLLTVLFSALGGLGVSMITHPPNTLLLGISGGVLGLLGLVLAVEWSVTRSLGEFLRRRNTRVVLFFLVLNAILAVAIEAADTTVKLDHSAHIAGFLLGLAGGLAYYGRRARRPRLALAVALILSVPPAAYAAHPTWDVDFHRYRAERARQARDEAREAAALERILALEPGDWWARTRLARLRNDPSYLEGIELPAEAAGREAIVLAQLDLALRRMESDPGAANELIRAALDVDFSLTLKLLASTGTMEHASEVFGSFRGRLEDPRSSPEARLALARNAADLAFVAIRRLARHGEPSERLSRYEDSLARLARSIAGVAFLLAGADPPPDGLRDLCFLLAKVHLKLADNTPGEERDADYLYRSAFWWWRAVEGTPEEEREWEAVRNRFRAALVAAERAGDAGARDLVEDWFRTRDRPLPEADLAAAGDGG